MSSAATGQVYPDPEKKPSARNFSRGARVIMIAAGVVIGVIVFWWVVSAVFDTPEDNGANTTSVGSNQTPPTAPDSNALNKKPTFDQYSTQEPPPAESRLSHLDEVRGAFERLVDITRIKQVERDGWESEVKAIQTYTELMYKGAMTLTPPVQDPPPVPEEKKDELTRIGEDITYIKGRVDNLQQEVGEHRTNSKSVNRELLQQGREIKNKINDAKRENQRALEALRRAMNEGSTKAELLALKKRLDESTDIVVRLQQKNQ